MEIHISYNNICRVYSEIYVRLILRIYNRVDKIWMNKY